MQSLDKTSLTVTATEVAGASIGLHSHALAPQPALTTLVVPLLKGVLYRDDDPTLWAALLKLLAQVRDFMAVMGLDVELDESEGYAYVRSKPVSDDDAPVTALPRLIPRRPLTFEVSLLLALLRKKLAEFDASGGDTRLILSRDAVVELVRVFLPSGTNESRLMDQIDTYLNRVIDLGFVRRLKPQATAVGRTAPEPMYEVLRILKAFVNAQWLADFDSRLAQYQQQLQQPSQQQAKPKAGEVGDE